MKTKINLFLTIALVIIAGAARANKEKDYVKLQLEKNSSIEFTVKDFYYIEKHGNLDSLYNRFLTDLKNFEGVHYVNQSNFFGYTIESEYVNLKQRTPCYDISVDREGNVIYYQTVGFSFENGDYILFKSGSAEGYEFFTKIGIRDITSQAKDIVFEKRSKHRTIADATFKTENGKVIAEEESNYLKGFDTMELGADVGVGTVKNFIVPDVGLSLIARITKKGDDWIHGGFSYEAPFFFETDENGEEEINIDGFANIFFGGDNYGGKFSVMVNNQSSVFKNETYRFAFYRDWKVRMESGIYISDYMREIYPYIRISKTW